MAKSGRWLSALWVHMKLNGPAYPVPGDQINPTVIGHTMRVVIVIIVRFGAMVGKVNITQTQVHRIQWDFNRST